MQERYRKQATRYLTTRIQEIERTLNNLRGDLKALEDPSVRPAWRAYVHSAWASEGEPDWKGTLVAQDIRSAVYEAMMGFCKNAGRVYPGYISSSTGTTYDRFDLQGDIHLYVDFPFGTSIPVDQDKVDAMKRTFNKKAPLPPEPRPPAPIGIS